MTREPLLVFPDFSRDSSSRLMLLEMVLVQVLPRVNVILPQDNSAHHLPEEAQEAFSHLAASKQAQGD